MVNVQYKFDPGIHFDMTEQIIDANKNNHESMGLSLDLDRN